MEFNDIVYPSCDFDQSFAKRLGFGRVLVIGRDVEIRDVDRSKNTNAPNCIAIGSNKQRLEAAVRSGAVAVEITDHRIDPKLMQTMREREARLLISFATLKRLDGGNRQRALYMMARLLRDATKMRINVVFASMAESRLQMMSCMQLIEMARLIGAEDKAARAGLGGIA